MYITNTSTIVDSLIKTTPFSLHTNTIIDSLIKTVPFSLPLSVTSVRRRGRFEGSLTHRNFIWLIENLFQNMISQNRDQYWLSVILCDFMWFFQWNWKNCFDDKHGILELKTWCQLMCYIIMNKYIPIIVWSSIYFFNEKNISEIQSCNSFISF